MSPGVLALRPSLRTDDSKIAPEGGAVYSRGVGGQFVDLFGTR